MAEIDIRDVRKSYGKIEVVHGVSLAIPAGEFVVVLGPSGCGKSTLLRMIAGLEGITAGEIAIGGQVVNRLEPRQRGCAMVFQNYALYPHMTVADNIGYSLKVAGVGRAERDLRVRTVAETLGLTDFLARKPGQLSGGQRQRVAMGRAMIREPRVFLYDEPLSNLDARLRVAMRVEIRKLHQRLGTTSIFVTHDQVEAMTLADRIVVMNKGSVEQVGTPSEVYRRPASTYVAAFIGTPGMNLLTATADPATRSLVLADGQRLPYDPDRFDVEAGRRVLAGFRAHAARLIPERGVAVSFDFAEELGSTRLLHGNLKGETLVAEAPAAETDGDLTQFRIAVDEAEVALFDPASTRRLPEAPIRGRTVVRTPEVMSA